MSYKQSHLSSENYGYDMVVAVTEAAVNMTMAKFLKKFEGSSFDYYLMDNPEYDDEQPDSETNTARLVITKEQAREKLAGRDIFSLDIKTDKKDILSSGVSLAVRAVLGFPNNMDDLAKDPNHKGIRDTLSFDQGYGTKTSFKMFFKQIEIRYVEYGASGGKVKSYSYAPQKKSTDIPVYFKFVVNLDLAKKANGFGALDEDVRKKLKNLNPDTMFSVRQLYVDLTTARLQESPELAGIERVNPIYNTVVTYMQNGLWKYLSDSGTTIELGSVAFPDKVNPNPLAPSIIPTDLNFMIMPYFAADKKTQMPENQGYYTLNYLISSQNRALNPPAQLGWNWVDEGSQAHGTMAIRRGVIMDFLKPRFEEAIKDIMLSPYTRISNNGLDADVIIEYSQEVYTQRYSISPTELNLLYRKSDKDVGGSDTFIKDFRKTMELNSHVESRVTFNQNKLIFQLGVRYWLHYTDSPVIGSKVDKEQDIFKQNFNLIFVLSVSPEGTLIFRREGTRALGTVARAEFNAKFVIDFNLGDKLNGMVSTMQNALNEVQRKCEAIPEELEKLLNNSNAWVFPGATTFTFRDPAFSDHIDLAAEITYVNP